MSKIRERLSALAQRRAEIEHQGWVVVQAAVEARVASILVRDGQQVKPQALQMALMPAIMEPSKTRHLVLNVGGHDKRIPTPPCYAGWEPIWLDIDPPVEPDILLDARGLEGYEHAAFNAVYCSHNLEHFFPHDVPKVLSGYRHVLKHDGFAELRVPDLGPLTQLVIKGKLALDVMIYQPSNQRPERCSVSGASDTNRPSHQA